MHPGSFEEAVRIVSPERLALLIHNLHRSRSLGKIETVPCESHAAARQGIRISFREIRCLQMDVVLVSLQLAAPETAEIDVNLTVCIVSERAHVYAVAARNRSRLGNERSRRIVGDGGAPVEHVTAVLEREVHYVPLHLLAVTHTLGLLLGIGRNLHFILLYVAVPELASCPRYILLAEYAAVVGYLACHRVSVDGQHVVILHYVLVAVVILDIVSLPVVGRVDVDFAVEDVNRRVGHIVFREKITFLCCHIQYRLIRVSIRLSGLRWLCLFRPSSRR